MAFLLHLLSYFGAVVAFVFVTLSLASGLLWIAELIEEHSRFAKALGQRAIYVIIVLHALLFVTDGLPFWLVAFGIVCHVVYLQHFNKQWPFISLTSPMFLASCVLVVADHFVWFFHFAGVAQEAKKYRASRYRYSAQQNAHQDAPSFMDVATFFGLCVWFIPLFLFLSLSANDNVIPSFGSSGTGTPTAATIDLSASPGVSPRPAARASSTSLVKSVLSPIVALLPRLGRRGRNDEGIIAPRTPGRATPSPRLSTDGMYAPWSTGGDPSSTPPPQMYSASLGMLDSRLSAVAATGAGGRTTPPPPSRPPMSKQNSVAEYPVGAAAGGASPLQRPKLGRASSDYEGSPLFASTLQQTSAGPGAAVRNRSVSDFKKMD